MANMNRRQGEQEKKHLTPPKASPPTPKPPHVREGDVILLSSVSIHPTVGVVVQVASGKNGVHRLVDAGGRDREIAKNPNSIFNQGFEKQLTIVGHDPEWLKLEKGLAERRRKFSEPHLREGRKIVAERRIKGE